MMDFGIYAFFFLVLQRAQQYHLLVLLLTLFCLCNNEQSGYTAYWHQMVFQSIDPRIVFVESKDFLYN